jgi:hypothetical protein
VGEQVLKEVKRRVIQPLQIVEEQRERMFRPCEYVDEAPEHELEPILSVLWWKVRNRWLRADYKLQFRDEVNKEQPVRVQSLLKTLAPMLELGLALTQQPAEEALKCLRQCCIRDVALVLVKFARCKTAAWQNQHLVELIDHGRFSDPGISGEEHQFQRATGRDSIEGSEQGVDFICSSIPVVSG